MLDVSTIVADLRSKGRENTRALYVRHGMPPERTLGASVADMKTIAKSIKNQQGLAMELYSTGIMEAMYLAGIVANGAKMSVDELEAWARGADALPMVSDYTVAWVALEHPQGRELALKWIDSASEGVASAGWATYSGLVTTLPDASLDFDEIRGLMQRVVRAIHTAPNRVRKAMLNFVIAVGSYVLPLTEEAKEIGRQIGKVEIDVGETACEVRQVVSYIAKVEAAGKLGKKRKTIRC
jgi:3-methyladenine DNA glycosylase AlkD